MSADKNEVGTELPRASSGHAASYAEGPRLVRGRENDAAADRNRLAAQARVKQLFDRRVKGVEVRVEDGGCGTHIVASGSSWRKDRKNRRLWQEKRHSKALPDASTSQCCCCERIHFRIARAVGQKKRGLLNCGVQSAPGIGYGATKSNQNTLAMRDRSAEFRETSLAPSSRHDRAIRMSNTRLRRTSRITSPFFLLPRLFPRRQRRRDALDGAGSPRLVLVREPDQLGVERAHTQLAFAVGLAELPNPTRHAAANDAQAPASLDDDDLHAACVARRRDEPGPRKQLESPSTGTYRTPGASTHSRMV